MLKHYSRYRKSFPCCVWRWLPPPYYPRQHASEGCGAICIIRELVVLLQVELWQGGLWILHGLYVLHYSCHVVLLQIRITTVRGHQYFSIFSLFFLSPILDHEQVKVILCEQIKAKLKVMFMRIPESIFPALPQLHTTIIVGCFRIHMSSSSRQLRFQKW